MNKAAAGILLILFGFSGKAFGNSADNEVKNWPNYEKDFAASPKGEEPYADFVSNTLKRKYISELPLVLLGKKLLYLNDLKNASEGVVEFSLLGNNKVMRVWLAATPEGVLVKQVQLRIENQWISGRLGARPRISLLDPEKLLKDDVVTGILISLDSDGNETPLELLLLNK